MITDIRVQAKKSLGQNFLVNEGALDRIVQAADIAPTDTITEIGPGTGALTKRLAATGARIIAIEKDHRLIQPLRKQFPNIEIIEGDIMNWNPEHWKLTTGNWKLVANIPYYLTSHLMRLVLEQWPSPSLAVLMVQEEVAHRIIARPPDMNLLALSVQLFATPSLVMKVSRGSFRPIPDVDSAVIKLDPKTLDQEHREENQKILALAKKFFAHKRKQMGIGPNPSSRPQELSVDDWKRLADYVVVRM